MPTTTIYTHASRAAILRAIASLPQEVCRGTASRVLMSKVGVAVLEKINQAFVIKMKGGTDEAGEKWLPLSPVTIALRRARGKAKSKPKRGGKGKGKSKAQESTTDTSQVEILHDTGLLLKSLSPDTPNSNQVFRVGDGKVTVGTNVPYVADHHYGRPGRKPPLPQRRLWPSPIRWPVTWWEPLLRKVRDGVVEVAARLIRNAR